MKSASINLNIFGRLTTFLLSFKSSRGWLLSVYLLAGLFDEKVVIETNLQGDIGMNASETDIVRFPKNSDIYISIDLDGTDEFEITARRGDSGDVNVKYELGNRSICFWKGSRSYLQECTFLHWTT